MKRFALALALCLIGHGALAQDCTLRCITIEQYMGEEMTARVPLICDAVATTCKGEGTLSIGGTPALVPITASYFADAVEVTLRMPFSLDGVGETQRILMSLDESAAQAKNAVLRWATRTERPFVTRYLPGHIRIVVERYRRP